MKQLYTKFRLLLRRNRVRLVCTGIVLTLILAFLWPSIVITVRPGELGVLYSRFFGGTQLDRTYNEGLHIIQPWDLLYIYDVRIQEETQNIDVLTVDGLTINVQVSLRFQIIRDRLPKLHQDIGPNYRNKIIIPIMNSAVRQTIGSYRPDDLYSTARQELQDQMLVDAVEEMGRIPILIHGFVVKSITLPEVLRKAIEDKLVAEQNYLRYNYLLLEAKQEAKRKAIEGEGIQIYQNLVNRNMTPNFLRYEGIKATKELAASPNAKVVVVGGKDGLPLILNADSQPAPAPAPADTEQAPKAAAPEAPEQQTPAAMQPDVPAKPAPAARTQNGTMPEQGKQQNTGWLNPDESVLQFIERLDKTLLNPNAAKTPKQ
ncbi:MAG: prohibitin family protein [Halodesulfovibrio sp.]